EELELEAQIFLLARLARLDFARCAIRRGREMRVAEAAASAARHEHPLACLGEVGEQAQWMRGIAGLFVDERADRHGELEVAAGVARRVRALPVLAAVG